VELRADAELEKRLDGIVNDVGDDVTRGAIKEHQKRADDEEQRKKKESGFAENIKENIAQKMADFKSNMKANMRAFTEETSAKRRRKDEL